ncbi:MAG: VOC family protein [Coriobacteriia bacterium]
MSRVIHFEFSTPDPQKEVDFFTTLFGWKIESWGEEQYWLVDTGTGDGINGAIQPQNAPDQPQVVNTIDVDDLDSSLQTAAQAGATIAVPKQEIPGIGWVAYVLSPTGIMFGMLQPAPNAEMG